MTDPLATLVRSTIFGGRNIQKGNNGHVGRYAVAVGQSDRVLNSIIEYDKTIGSGNSTAVNALKTVVEKVGAVAKNDVVVDYACKAVKFASENVNPLICVSAGIDVLTADDKKSALVKNATALGSMFTVEHYMGNEMDNGVNKLKTILSEMGKTNKTIGNICEKIEKSGHGGKLESIAKGVAFVIGSCAAYDIGEGFGKLLLGQHDNKTKA